MRLVSGAIYWTLVAFFRLVTNVFFRTIEVVGRENIPTDGPVIFLGNHPNSLIDPLLITTTCRRRVRFAAKDTLFDSPFLRPLLWALGAVPIRRKMDHGAKPGLDNTSAFDALFAVLRQGGTFGIFPEGISHAMSELAPLKTGAARIALGARKEGAPVVVVPCGLNYRQRHRLRSRVLVQFGAPIVIDEKWLAAYEADERESVRALTAEFEQSLRALTINTQDFDVLRVLDGVRRLYQPARVDLTLADQAEVLRRLIEHYNKLKDEAEVKLLYRDTESYMALIDALGITDRDLSKRVSMSEWFFRIARHAFLLVILAPIAIPGLLLHLPVIYVAIRLGEGLTDRHDVVATVKMIITVLFVLATYVAIVALLFVVLPYPYDRTLAPAALVLLLVSGWATIRVLERQAVLLQGVNVLARLFDLTQELGRLSLMRDGLRARVLELVDRYLDPKLERIVSRDLQE